MSPPLPEHRTGLVLAAGHGSRHAVGSDPIPKPLLEVAGRPLLVRVLDVFAGSGCSRAVVVLGHEESRIRQFLRERYSGPVEVVCVSNPRYDLQNGVSVLAARELLPGEFILAMADHVFDRSVMSLITGNTCPPDGAYLVVDSKLDTILDIEDATKVMVQGDRVIRIGKALAEYNAVDCGLFLASDALLRALNEIFLARGDVSVSEGVQALASTGRMYALDLGEGRWQDVDDAEMLTAAEHLLDGSRPSSTSRH